MLDAAAEIELQKVSHDEGTIRFRVGAMEVFLDDATNSITVKCSEECWIVLSKPRVTIHADTITLDAESLILQSTDFAAKCRSLEVYASGHFHSIASKDLSIGGAVIHAIGSEVALVGRLEVQIAPK